MSRFPLRPSRLSRLWPAVLQACRSHLRDCGGERARYLPPPSNDTRGRQYTEAELRLLEDQARSAARIKAEFLATINHELRTPLNAVIGFSELLEQQIYGPLGHPRYVEYASLIRTSGHHLLRLLTEIIDISRHGTGMLNLHLEPVALDDVILRCRQLLANKAEQAGITMVVELPPGPVILADRARLEHALLNLISNAVKFSKPGGRVTVAAKLRDNSAEIVIGDTGVGMNAAELRIALEPFRQVDGSHERRHEGVGLGLPVAKRLIEMHGGSLRIDSMPGRGTTVRVLLPHTPSPMSESPADTSSAEARAALRAQPQGPRNGSPV